MTRHAFPLSARELQLVLELLESEQRELPPELHHTDNPTMRDEIHARMRDVSRLIRRLNRTPAESRGRRVTATRIVQPPR